MIGELAQYWVWFVMGSGLVVLFFVALGGRQKQAQRGTAPATAGGAAALGEDPLRVGIAPAAVGVRFADQAARQVEQREQHQDRMIQAGLYNRNAAVAFIVVRILLGGSLVGLGVMVGRVGLLSYPISILIGLFCGLAGTIAPSFWLDAIKRSRQRKVRRALPDALDVIGVCLEGGMSLAASMARVARELGTAHPLLAVELAIVERESQMGMTTGEAMRRFANRFDLEELRSLSAIIIQVEKLGGSISSALTVYANSLRVRRRQHAEEMAQKAAIKILFPTLFCIFPGIFIVILGPAAIKIYLLLIKGGLF